ncbi:MAG: ferrous iron transport protein B [Succinivibrionaceae bacterium]|nr:ferrous iron transport protein B [Succinivibrionaceae bacterium]
MKSTHEGLEVEQVRGSLSPSGAAKSADARHVMLAGNPNCGKSTIFNRLCNMHVRTGNYPGVTVSRHVGNFAPDVQLIDLPGTYSLSSASTDEQVASSELLDNDAELIVNIVDGTSLERSIYLTLELKMLGIPMILVINMWDEVKKQGIVIDTAKLAETLQTDVIAVSAATGEGLEELKRTLNDYPYGIRPPVYLGSESIRDRLEDAARVTPDLFKPLAIYYAKSALIGDRYPKGLEESDQWKDAIRKAREELTADGKTIYQSFAEDRYAFIDSVLKECVGRDEKREAKESGAKGTLTDRIDSVVLNRYAAFPVFLLIMFAVYYISVTWLGSIATDWTNDTLFGETVIPSVSEGLASLGAADWICSMVADGIVGGVGAVLGFVPQMVILFALLSILEECGYMTRASFILDRLFNMLGLSGRAFIPYLIGSGCGVPALMTARTLGSESERRITLMTTTMIPCGAKLPIIIVFSGAVFSDVPFFAPLMYLAAVFMIVISALILKKFHSFKQSSAPVMLELPAYHIPMLRVVLLSIWHRTRGYVIKAGTIIMPCVAILWLLTHIGFAGEEQQFRMLEDEETGESLVADIVKPVSVVFAPVGFDDYRASVAVITGLLAKESIVSTMAVFTQSENPEDMDEEASDEEVEEARNSFYEALRNNMFDIKNRGTVGVLAALAFVFFNLFTIPCVAAVGVLRKEIGSSRLFWLAVAYQLAFSYGAALVTFQLGALFCGVGSFGIWTAVAILYLLAIAYIIFIKKAPSQQEDLMEPIRFKQIA